MQVSPYNFQPHFFGRNKKVKKADDAQRTARRVFPMASPTYFEEFYLTMKPESKNYKRAYEISKNTWENVCLQRTLASAQKGFFGFFGFANRKRDDDTSKILDLEWIKDCKIGCCDESAETALAVLCANGYCNSTEAYAMYEVKFVNKKSGKIEYSNRGMLPHCFVVTDLNKEEPKEVPKNFIIVDPWLGFADYVSGAFARFKQAFAKDLDAIVARFEKDFAAEKQRTGKEYNPDDYEIKTGFIFQNKGIPASFSSKQEFGRLVRDKYPETILDKKS